MTFEETYRQVLRDFYAKLDVQLWLAMEAGNDLAVKFGPTQRASPADPFTYEYLFVQIPPGVKAAALPEPGPWTIYHASAIQVGRS